MLGTKLTLHYSFVRFRSVSDRLRALRAKHRLFSLPHRIFLDEDLTWPQVAELKPSRELVAAARQVGKWVVIHNLWTIIQIPLPSATLNPRSLNDGLVEGGNRVRVSQWVVGMTNWSFWSSLGMIFDALGPWYIWYPLYHWDPLEPCSTTPKPSRLSLVFCLSTRDQIFRWC